jgi:hypothetical protein
MLKWKIHIGGRIFMHKDTVELYFKTNSYDNNAPDECHIYIYNGKGLTPCKDCKQTINIFIAYSSRSSEWPITKIRQTLWNDISISDYYNNDGFFTVSTKNGKEINYTPFEELAIQKECILLTTNFTQRDEMYNLGHQDYKKNNNNSYTVSKSWANSVNEYLEMFEYFDKAFNSYKSNQNSENQGQVRYWLTKLIDANTTITNVLRRSNDGSMSTTEQSDYLRMAETKSQELQKFSDNLGKSSVSVLEAIAIGLARGGR